jgi:hypothetical protein
VKARDVLAVRDRLIDDLTSGRWNHMIDDREQFEATREGRPNMEAISAGLKAAELFFVTAPMSRLAQDAGRKLPSYKLNREDLPAQVGLLVWEDPHLTTEEILAGYTSVEKAEMDCVGILWLDLGDRIRIQEIYSLARYELSEKPEIYPIWRQRYPLYHYGNPYFVPYGEQVWPDWGTLSVEAVDAVARQRTELVVTWLLMGQEIVTIGRHVPHSKAAIRRAARNSLPALVRTVTLRYTHHDPEIIEAHLEGEGRIYRHRWYVRGHWRNQWYPSRDEHRPIWIPSYIKGPDGAPLLTGTIVKVLSR